MAVMTFVCGSCGERNAPGTSFCINCGAFLAWDEREQRSETRVVPTPSEPQVQQPGPEEYDDDTTLVPVRSIRPEFDPPGSRLLITPRLRSVTVPATGESVALPVEVTNTSTIVDSYVVEAAETPPWLVVESEPNALLPGTEGAMNVQMRVNSTDLVPAQQIGVMLRVRSSADSEVWREVPIRVTVPLVDVPIRLRASPQLIRTMDTGSSKCDVEIDNSHSNGRMRLRLSGSDVEQAVQFDFKPPTVDVGPGEKAVVVLNLTATQPEPGQELTRWLTISANDGRRYVETVITLQQATSERVDDTPVAPGRIFISYRRADSIWPTGWLYSHLASHFGRDDIVRDIDSIEPGDDFSEVISDAVASCDVMLVVIGTRWIGIKDERSRRRLDLPDDFVRREIEAALERDIRVIPILVDGATMPSSEQLPPSLAKLSRRQALDLSPQRFEHDAGRLLRVLDKIVVEEKNRHSHG